MGICWGSPSHEYISSGNVKTSTSVGTSNCHGNNTGFSATSSGSRNGKFSEAASTSTDGAYLNGEILETPNLKVFSFSDLKSATRNFKSDYLLGEDGHGKAFMGWVDEKTLAPSKLGSGTAVAIKKLKPESVEGFIEWQARALTTVLLQQMAGMRTLDKKRPAGQQHSAQWIKPILPQRRKLKNVIDPWMEGQHSFKEGLPAVQLTLKCLALQPIYRPSMKEVVETLKRIESIKDKPKQDKCFFSFIG